ncbi:MAG TPA: TPM domain-containing protein, partial [Stackebrandtia sp.]|uniref:TPM domain-containing protein n=1 Tax=Stackebrandtia sp. TaxID=2023065 RepID=UPI002D5FE400
MARLTGFLTAVAAAAAVTLAPAAAAHAEEPVDLDSGQVTDHVGALGGRESEVASALDRLNDDHRVQLFVVYVNDFSGQSASRWADDTAIKNGLGRRDALMAVATDARQYTVSVDKDFPLSDAKLDNVASVAIEPALSKNDWAGAAIGAARGYDAELSGRAVPSVNVRPGAAHPSKGGAGWIWLVVLVALAAVGLAVWWFARSRGRGAPARGRTGEPLVPLPDLDRQASSLLLQTDDAIRTSEQELGFATAQFGDDATKTFTDSLAESKTDLNASFRLRQQLDDSTPETEPQRRAMLDEIIERCTRANQRLDAVAADFEQLRDLVARAPEAV